MTLFLDDEKVDSFVWLIEPFSKAIRGQKSIMIIIYQDPTIKIVVENVFIGSSQRFGMWHSFKKH